MRVKLLSNSARSLVILFGLFLLMGTTVHTKSRMRDLGRSVVSNDTATSEGFQLSLQSEKEAFLAEEPIVLNLTLRNISTEEGRVIGANPYQLYKFIVTDQKGVTMPLAEFGKHLAKEEGDFLGRAVVTIGPEKEVREKIEINKIFIMDAPGVYSVTAKRIGICKREREGVGELTSNTAFITIN